MEELDEFGIPIRKPKAEVDEFGIPIKKKILNSTSNGGSTPALNGSKPFIPKVDTLAPTVLTPQKQKEYIQKQSSDRKKLSDQLNVARDAFRSAQGEELAEEIESFNPKQESFVEPEKDPSFIQSVANTGSNIVTGLKQFIPNTTIAVTDGLTQVLGKDLGGDVYAQLTRGGSPELQRQEAYQTLAELEPQFKQTRGLIEAGEKFDVPGLAAATIDAVGSLVRTAVTSIPTAGFGLYSDMVGSSVANYNKQKAKSLGMTVDELYGKGENDYFVPATIGGVGAQLEKIGLKGVQSAINKQLVGGTAKKMALLFNDVNKEGLTEWLQTGLEKANTSLASGKDAGNAGVDAVSEMFSKKGLESYLMGVVGSGGAAGLGRIAKGITSPKSKEVITNEVDTLNRFTEEIVKPEVTPESKEFLETQIRDTVGKIASEIDKDADVTERLGAEQKQEIQDLEKNIAFTERVSKDQSLSQEVRDLALERLEGLNKDLESKLKEKPKLTDKDAVIDEEVNEVIETPERTIESEILIEEPNAIVKEVVSESGLEELTQEQVEVSPQEEIISNEQEKVQSEDIRPEPVAGSDTAVTEKVATKVEAELLETPKPIKDAGFELAVVETPSGKFRVVETNSKKPVGKLYDTKEELIADYDANKDKITVERLNEVTGVKPKEVVNIEAKSKPVEYKDIRSKDDTPEKLSSKVNEKVWYHGSGKDLTNESVSSAAFSKPDGLLGLGFYMTDNPEIADSYANLGRNKRAGIINEFKVKTDKILDAEKPIDSEIENLYRETFNYYVNEVTDADKFFDDIKKENPNISLMDYHKKIREIISDGEYSSDEVLEAFQDLEIGLKDKLGYDAISHVGGVQTKGEKHNVIILLDPSGDYSTPKKYFTSKSLYSKENVSLIDKGKDSKTTVKEPVTELKEENKAGDPLRALADKIEKGKINKLGGFKASTGFDSVWDGSLTVVAQSLRTGAKLADAIEAGLKYVRQTDWYKGLSDKKDFEFKYRAHLRQEYESETTTLRNADVEQKRKEYGFDEPLPKTKVTNEETLTKAQQAIKEDSQLAYDIIDKAINKQPLDATEMAVLAQFQATKEAELIRANEKIEEAKDSSVLAFNNAVDARGKIIDDLIMAYDASELSSTTAGRALQARKIKVLQDYSLAGMLIRKRKANSNQNLTNEQINEVTEKYNALVEAEKKLKEKIAKLEDENSKLKLKEFTPKIRVEANREARENRRTQTKETLKKERESIFEEMRKVIKKSRGEVSMNPIPIEMIPLVGKLAKNYFVDGMTSIEAIVDKIHGDLIDIVEGVTKRDVRDAISGYNRDTRPTKDDLQRDIQDLKTQAKLISQIEDAENGVKKAKTEVKRKEASEEVEMLRARLKDLTKGETALEGLKTRIRKQIIETQKKLDNNDYSKKVSETVELDDEARKLQDQYRKIKYEFDVALAKDELNSRTRGERLRDLMIEIWNIPRALMATADLSAPLRQGILPTISNPIMAKRAFVEMLKQWNSEERADRWLADLKDSPGYQLMQEAGLYIADKTNPSITAKEEDFQTNLAEKLPIVGKGFKLSDAGVLEGTKVGDIKFGEVNLGGKKVGNFELIGRSERAYVSYLNKMRADLFSRGVDVLQNQGMSYASHPKAFEALATYINASTGRGNLGALERAAPVLNAVFFSPRLMASRIQLLTNFANPSFYKNTPKAVRNMYFKDMAKFISFGLGVLALAGMAGADTEDDPRSPDFGKIKKGNTRWDIWGGFQQFVRYFSQIALGEKKSSASGRITPLDGTGYNKETRLTTLMDLGRSKLAPVPAFIINYLAGSNMVGDKFNATKDLQNMAYPLVWQGIYDSYKQDGALFAVGATGVPSMLGVGVQTYGVNDFLQQGVDDKSINLLKSKKAVAIEPREGDKKIYDVKTGDEREMTDAEFKKYYATWVDGIKKGLTTEYQRLSKLTPAEFEKEFRSIKTRASKQAKEAVIGFDPQLTKIEIEGDDYKLNEKQLEERQRYIDAFVRMRGRNLIRIYMSKGKTRSEAEKLMQSKAKAEATMKFKAKHKDGRGLEKN